MKILIKKLEFNKKLIYFKLKFGTETKLWLFNLGYNLYETWFIRFNLIAILIFIKNVWKYCNSSKTRFIRVKTFI